MPDTELMTVTEMAQLLRTSERAVRQRVTRESIPAHLVVPDVKPMLFYTRQVREWLNLDVVPLAAND